MRGRANRVLTAGDVALLYQLYGEGSEAKELAQQFGTTISTVTRIIRGQVWTEVTGGRNISRYDAMVAFRCAYITARWDQGCRSQAALAAELGISRQAINRFMIRHQLGHHAQTRKAAA
jgi:plasmid maintenance system antidote protein VapI